MAEEATDNGIELLRQSTRCAPAPEKPRGMSGVGLLKRTSQSMKVAA